VLEEGTLAVNLLTFRRKSFGYERTVALAGRTYALFRRSETESEAKLRPRVLTLWVAVPLAWVIYDEPGEALVLGTDGATPGPQPPGTALEAAADAARFDEQGIAWARRALAGGTIVYAPAAEAETLLAPAGLAALGIAGAP
jgi:hypothetical protein